MADELTQHLSGIGGIGIQGLSGPTVNVTQVIGKSVECREIEDHLNILQQLFDRTTEEEIQKRLELSGKINEQKTLLEKFKQDVIKLADTFDRIELNTARLQKAKEYFNKGGITEARVLLEDAEKERLDAKKRALAKKKDFEENILPTLQDIAVEYLLLAQTTALNYESPSRFEDTCGYFEASVESRRSLKNLFAYANFLREHNQFDKAAEHYQQILQDPAHEISQPERARVLNNLGLALAYTDEFEAAEAAYSEALEIRKELAREDPDANSPYLARTLHNVGLLNHKRKEYAAAEAAYSESLQIQRELVGKNIRAYLSEMATTLDNLAVLHRTKTEYEAAEAEHAEALQIRRELAEKNPRACLPAVAMTLNNLGNLHCSKNEYEAAETAYSEALQIYRKLAKENPRAYLPNLAVTSSNLASFYQEAKSDREISISFAYETLIILQPFLKHLPATQGDADAAKEVLKDWGISDEEIEQKIAEMVAAKK